MTITTQEAEHHPTLSQLEMRQIDANFARSLYQGAVEEGKVNYERLQSAAQNARDSLSREVEPGLDPLGIATVQKLHRIIEHNDAQQAYLKVTELIEEGKYRKAGEVARKLVATGTDYLFSGQKLQMVIAAEDYGQSPREVLTEAGRTISGGFEAVKGSVADSYVAGLAGNVTYGAMEIVRNPRSTPEVLKDALRGVRAILREDVGSLVQQGTQKVKEAYDARVARREAEKALAEATTKNIDAPITVDEILARNITGVNISQHYGKIVPRVEVTHEDPLFDEIRIGYRSDDWDKIENKISGELADQPTQQIGEAELRKLILAMENTDDKNPYLRELTWEEDQAHVAAWVAKNAEQH